MYQDTTLPIRPGLKEAHEWVWEQIGRTGSYWSGADRVAIVEECRNSLICSLCKSREKAISPNVVEGDHNQSTDLPRMVVDLIHRLRTDPARYTKSVFNRFKAEYSNEEYIELVSVVCSSVIIDTFHNAIGCELPSLGSQDQNQPPGHEPASTEDGGAWVPLASQDQSRTDLGFRRVPNILRSMGCVPSAVTLFFTCFRNHYSMMGVPLELADSQGEFIAARVSALNQCFY